MKPCEFHGCDQPAVFWVSRPEGGLKYGCSPCMTSFFAWMQDRRQFKTLGDMVGICNKITEKMTDGDFAQHHDFWNKRLLATVAGSGNSFVSGARIR